jgi:hypothetical protein
LNGTFGLRWNLGLVGMRDDVWQHGHRCWCD